MAAQRGDSQKLLECSTLGSLEAESEMDLHAGSVLGSALELNW